MKNTSPLSAEITKSPSTHSKPPEGVETYPPIKSETSVSPVPTRVLSSLPKLASTNAVFPVPGTP